MSSSSAPDEMAGAGAARRCPVRRRPRRVDRQRRAAVDRPRPELLPGQPVVGRQRLHARPSAASCCSAGGWPTCSAAAACSSIGLVLFAVASLAGGLAQSEGWLIAARAVQGLGAALLSPAALSLVTVDLHRGRRAQQGAGRLGRGRRLRRRRRRAARRHAHRVGRLGVGPVRQRADRHRRGAARPAPAAREPQRGRAPLRHRRRGDGHRRPVAARLRAGRRQQRRLGLDRRRSASVALVARADRARSS